MKHSLGQQIRTLRKSRGVTTYQLRKLGIHPTMPKTIEEGGDYSINSLEKYLNAIEQISGEAVGVSLTYKI